ncbi:MAG: bifunctional nuclease family protein, partial [Deltaproteobacteria bacterium]|nr:bifunctional nuclease family protein [Deltaproteobacteria bacterium]
CTSGDKEFILDARPSDAISLALRFKAPIYVEEKVIKKSEMVAAGPEVADKSEEGKKWAEYLEKLSPEDFGKYKI